MIEPEKRALSYLGFEAPNTLDEIQLEILGLEYAAKMAETQASMLKQSYQLEVTRHREREQEDSKRQMKEIKEKADGKKPKK